MTIPLLILGDAPDCKTGLGRITRDLATLASTWPEFRVATLGRGGVGSCKFPFAYYNFNAIDQWGEAYIEQVWEDFAGQDEGVIFTIWDPSRLGWFSEPGMIRNLPSPLRKFLQSGRFKRWGYFPVDAEGPNGQLSVLSSRAVQGFDRVLAYSMFGKLILDASIGSRAIDDLEFVDFIPHGIDPLVFSPRPKKAGRVALGVSDEPTLVGINMSNQSRKDWGVWAQTAALLPKLQWWVQVDLRERYWSLEALIYDFGLEDRVHFGQVGADDETLSYYYSACDVTILPSLGEGFGYPIAESLACGVPAIHHTYAAGSETIPQEIVKVVPIGYRLDTINNVYRPIFNPQQWAAAIEAQLELDLSMEVCTQAVQHLWWSNIGPIFRDWFLRGLV